MVLRNNKLKNFNIIGAAGYVAPRHMKAIYQTNNKLIGGETMIGFNESSPITMQDAIKVVRN